MWDESEKSQSTPSSFFFQVFLLLQIKIEIDNYGFQKQLLTEALLPPPLPSEKLLFSPRNEFHNLFRKPNCLTSDTIQYLKQFLNNSLLLKVLALHQLPPKRTKVLYQVNSYLTLSFYNSYFIYTLQLL